MLKVVGNRIDEVIKKGVLNNKTVLEFGCVGMGEDDEYGGINWIHGKAAKVAKKVVGLDLNREGVAKLRKKGYDIRYQNVEEKFDLHEKFDVVLVEEVFEHLSNVGIAMDNVRRHLKKGGYLVITTPHAQSVSFFMQRLFRDKISGVSITDHTHWYDESTLKTLLKRYNFKAREIWYVQPKAVHKTALSYALRFVWLFFPQRVGRNLCCIAQKMD